MIVLCLFFGLLCINFDFDFVTADVANKFFNKFFNTGQKSEFPVLHKV